MNDWYAEGLLKKAQNCDGFIYGGGKGSKHKAICGKALTKIALEMIDIQNKHHMLVINQGPGSKAEKAKLERQWDHLRNKAEDRGVNGRQKDPASFTK